MISPLIQVRVPQETKDLILAQDPGAKLDPPAQTKNFLSDWLKAAVDEKLGLMPTAKAPAPHKATQAPKKSTKPGSPRSTPKGRKTVGDRIATAVKPCPHRHASVCEECEKEGWPNKS